MKHTWLAWVLLGFGTACAVVIEQYGPVAYTGNGSNVNFAFGFSIDTVSELIVTLVDSIGGEDEQVLNSDYTVSATSNDYRSGPGGTVTFITAPVAGYTVVISREMPQTQDRSASALARPVNIYDGMDKLTMITQDLQEQIRHCFRGPVSTFGADMNLPDGFDADTGYLYWNGAGPTLSTSIGVGAAATAWGQTWIQQNDSDDARTILGAEKKSVTNVKDAPYNATGDGTTDDTTAIQAALTAAATDTGVCFFPAGVFRITDGLTLPPGVSCYGVHVGNQNRIGKTYFERQGATIYFDANDAGTSPFLTLTSTANQHGEALTIRDIDFVGTADANQPGRHGIRITAVSSGLGDWIIERCRFASISGYPIYASGNAYWGHPGRISDCIFNDTGGAVKVMDASKGYTMWGLVIENCHWEGAPTMSPLDPIWDLRSVHPLTMRNIVTEGYMPSANVTAIMKITADRDVLIDGWHDEWTGAAGYTDPNYWVIIGRQGVGDEVAAMNGTTDFRRIKTEAPILVDVNDITIRVDRVWWDNSSNLSDFIEITGASENVEVQLNGFEYNSQTERSYTEDEAFGGFYEPNRVGEIAGTIVPRNGTPSGISLALPTSRVLYDWDTSKGPLSAYSTRDVSAPAFSYAMDEAIVTDSEEGRVVKVPGSAGKTPKVLWTWNLPDGWETVNLTYVVRFKPVCSVGTTAGGYWYWLNPTGNSSTRSKFWWTVINDLRAAHFITETEKWQTAVGHLDKASNSGTFGFIVSNHPTSGTVDYYISHVMVLLGDDLPCVTGSVGPTQPIQWRATAAPTDANWVSVKGDMVWNSDPDAGEAPAWICTVTASPGTWKAMGTITP